MGRYGKGPGQVRRPNRHHWRDLPASPTAPAPPLPERHDGQAWTADATLAWRAWWGSPMAAVWLEADQVALRRAIRLVDDAARGRRGTDGALLALLDRLGLTPAGRLRLQWLVAPTPVVISAPREDPRTPG